MKIIKIYYDGWIVILNLYKAMGGFI